MKPIFIFAAIIAITLLFTVPLTAQEAQPSAKVTDTLPTVKMDSVVTPSIKTDSPKTTKKTKRKKKESDTTGYNPYYYSGNTVGKPLPYNSNKEKEKPVEKPILPVGEIIRDAVIPKKNN